MKRTLVAFLFLLPFVLNAQTARVEGTVAADKDALILGQAIVFSASDSTLKKGSYLDTTALSIIFNTGGESEFYLKLKIPGYSDTLVNFSVVDSVVDLGIITPVEKGVGLDEVEVTYKKPTFERTMDGISVNVDGTELQTLTNLFDVLKASPKITSPDDETIEIIGRGQPLIMVDRQAIISNDELKAIPANQIERIEIITNPSAKYKAQGSGNGVIEVFTKDFHLEGYNMTVRGEAGLSTQIRPAAGLSLGLSLKKNKFSLNGYLGANYRARNGFGNGIGETTDDSNRKMESEFDFDNANLWQYYSVKSAYRFTDKQRLTFGVNGYGGFWKSDNNAVSDFSTNDIVETKRRSESQSEDVWLNNSAFVNYLIETDTNKSTFEINLNYVNKVSTDKKDNFGSFEYIPTSEKTIFEIRNDARDIPNVGELRVNYEHNFDTTRWRLNVGGAYSTLYNGKRFDQYNRVDGEWIVDPIYSNSYDYQEHIGALFVEVSKNWDKIGFRAGVRAEYTKLDGYSNSLNKQFMDSSYILPFPSASILYEPTENVAMTFFYDSGIDRPQFSNYDPFVRLQDSLNVEYGNPYLRPALEHTLGVDVDLFYSYNLSVSYTYIHQPESQISFVNQDSYLIETTPWNADAEEAISISMSLPFELDWLSGWNSIWIDYTKYTFTSEFNRDPFFNLTYGLYSYLTFSLPEDFSLMNRFHLSKWGGAESEMNARANWGLRLTKKWNGNKFQLFLDVDNIFPPRNDYNEFSGNYIYRSSSRNQFTTFKLGFFVKFGRLKQADYIEESTSGQSDRL